MFPKRTRVSPPTLMPEGKEELLAPLRVLTHEEPTSNDQHGRGVRHCGKAR